MSENKIIMPKELTSENGAKGLLMGKFSESVEMTCLCDHEDRNYNEEPCEFCDDTGTYLFITTISWINIKDIYNMVVNHFGKEIK